MDAMGDTPSDRRQLLLQTQPDGNGTVTVSIQDNGCGIPSDQLERVFDLFHSTKSTGLGVGLSISRTIIESHGGRIWAENHPHGGTTVRFTLPVAAWGATVTSLLP
jgi:signal transduction histidine kinase